MHEINKLNQRYGTAGRIAFRKSAHGTVEAVLVNGYGSCEISLYGGQVLNYRPMGHTPPSSSAARATERKKNRSVAELLFAGHGSAPLHLRTCLDMDLRVS